MRVHVQNAGSRTCWPDHPASGKRAPECPQPGLNRGNLRGDFAYGLAACQPEPRAPAPHVHRGGHDFRPGQPDGPGDIGPGLQLALDTDPRAPAPVCPPRHRPDRRADGQGLRERRSERAQRGCVGNPRAGRKRGGGRMQALDQRGQRDEGITFCRCYVPEKSPIKPTMANMVMMAGRRWGAEETMATAKGPIGWDEASSGNGRACSTIRRWQDSRCSRQTS